MGKKGNVVLIVVVVIGIISIAGLIFLLTKANEEASKMYDDMAKEQSASSNDPVYGYGTELYRDLIKDGSKYENKKKPKPIIFVTPTLKKKK